jgi:REP element-mobilizing transposase RayT
MPQSLSNLVVHAIFSTYHRAPTIDEEIQPRLFAYLGGILRQEGSNSIIIGGCSDHVHLLFGLAKTKSLSDTLRVTKARSSKWIKESFPHVKHFAWHAGYAAYSVGRGDVDRVRLYIENQREHHQIKSFQDELRDLCSSNGIEIDERYIWD